MFEIVGFCNVEVNPFGPVQLHDVAPVALPDNVNVAPSQIGFGLADAVTPVGTEFIVTEAVFAAEAAPQVLLVVNEYMPAPAEVIFEIVGF
jgi:hypothetical protein